MTMIASTMSGLLFGLGLILSGMTDPSKVLGFLDLAGARTVVCVPMLKDNEVVGAISIYRQQVRSFTDKQIALLTNFAA